MEKAAGYVVVKCSMQNHLTHGPPVYNSEMTLLLKYVLLDLLQKLKAFSNG